MPFGTFETLLVEERDQVLYVTIQRPQVLNALNATVLQELHKVLDAAKTQEQLRALVLAGAGEKAFVAGADIAAMKELTPVQALQFARLGQDLTTRLEAAPFVTIARVQGFALGGGCELAMACDVIVASEKALFGQPEVDLGLIAGFGGTQRLARRVGLPVALEVLCAGRKLNGREAQQLGLVSQVTAPEELDNYVANLLKQIRKAAPHAVAESKRLARASLEQPLHSGLSAEASAFATCFAGHEAREGLNAFLEKRPAKF